MKKQSYVYFILGVIAIAVIAGFFFSTKEGFQNKKILPLNQQPWKTVEELKKQASDIKELEAQMTRGLTASYNKAKKSKGSTGGDPKWIAYTEKVIKDYEDREKSIASAKTVLKGDIEKSKAVLKARISGLDEDKRVRNPNYTKEAQEKHQGYKTQLSEISKLPTPALGGSRVPSAAP